MPSLLWCHHFHVICILTGRWRPDTIFLLSGTKFKEAGKFILHLVVFDKHIHTQREKIKRKKSSKLCFIITIKRTTNKRWFKYPVF